MNTTHLTHGRTEPGETNMPKNRRRNPMKGAKSISIHTTNKIGGRKSGQSANAMSNEDLQKALTTVRKRDRNKLRRVWRERMA